MTGNWERYEASMNAGHDAAWENNWGDAVRYYTMAVQEIPDNGDAHLYLGLSLLNSGRLEDALRVYKRTHQLLPDDPAPLERSADVLERLGRLKEAAEQYIAVADIFLAQRDLDKAIGNWARATQLTPGLVSIHARLAQAYERVGDKKRALREYLTLAFNFQRAGETDKAVKAVERALRIDRRNPQALNTLRALRSGVDVALQEFDDDDAPKKEEAQPVEQEAVDEENKINELGPIGESMQDALRMLADYITSSGKLDQSTVSLMQGMELQRKGNYAQAIKAYKHAISDIDHVALRLSLGSMLHLEGQSADAIDYLARSMETQKLAAGALHGLGLANMTINRQRPAARYLLQSLQAVDTSLVMSDNERGELSTLYSRLLGALDGAGDEMLESINNRFADLLQGTDWKSRIPMTRKLVSEILDTQGDQGVRDFFSTGGSDQLAEVVSKIDHYISKNLYTLAMDEAHDAMKVAPYYLPIHVRMAEIMMREGRPRQAITKYNVVAHAYMAREEYDRAASILIEVVESAPLDIEVRQSLIALLEDQERMDDALVHYIALGRAYGQLGDFDSARDTLHIAERIARRIEAPASRLIAIKYQQAEMEQVRMDTRRAVRIYEEIIDLDPNEERAYRLLVESQFGQGNNVEAVKVLDRLLGLYAKRRDVGRMVQVLEYFVRQNGRDPALRSRLAAIYQQTQRKADAITQLDALGEIQLAAGLRDDARNTIKRIIMLNPDNVNDYKRLLMQLQ
jgi:tetratricopeptide (TPR) repeat protein